MKTNTITLTGNKDFDDIIKRLWNLQCDMIYGDNMLFEDEDTEFFERRFKSIINRLNKIAKYVKKDE